MMCIYTPSFLFFPQRCTHKEVSGDYRTLAASLVSELLTFLPLPDWPCAAILLEQLILQGLKQLNTESSTTDTTSNKKDAPYTSFLLDLLGSACVGLRSVLLVSEQEKKASASFTLPLVVVTSLSAKLSALSDTWVAAAEAHQQQIIDTLGATTTSTSKKITNKGGKGSKNNSSSRSNSPSVDTACTMDVSTALDALLEIASSTVDAIAETPLHSTVEYSGDSIKSENEYTALPAPLEILRSLPQHQDLVR